MPQPSGKASPVFETGEVCQQTVSVSGAAANVRAAASFYVRPPLQGRLHDMTIGSRPMADLDQDPAAGCTPPEPDRPTSLTVTRSRAFMVAHPSDPGNAPFPRLPCQSPKAPAARREGSSPPAGTQPRAPPGSRRSLSRARQVINLLARTRLHARSQPVHEQPRLLARSKALGSLASRPASAGGRADHGSPSPMLQPRARA